MNPRTLIPLLAVIAVCAQAQTTRPPAAVNESANASPSTARPAAPTGTTEDADAVELSPFEVTAEESGYYTDKGVSSGRLGVDLKDSAANVNVFTKDLAFDLGAIDLGNMIEYSNSMQLDQADFTGSSIDPVLGEGAGRANISGRARGLPTIRLVDYEQADWEIDNYNVDRTDIFLGTDAILFGNGSVGGTINSSRDSARLNRSRTIVSYNVGSDGRNRGTIDSNVIAIPDVLAFRLSLLDFHSDGSRMWDYADRRATSLAATFQPVKGTTLKFSYDTGRNKRHQPMINNLPENRVSQWLNSTATNKVVSPTLAAFPGGNAALIAAGLEQALVNGGRIFQDPATGLTSTAAISPYWYGSPRTPDISPYINGVGATSPTATNPTRLVYFRPRNAGSVLGTGDTINTEVLPTSIFDYDNISFAGPDSRYAQKYRDARVTFEQRLAKNLYFRTYFRASHSDQNSQFARRNGINPAVWVDPYSTGPNDPYTGRYFSIVQWRQQTAEDERRAWVSNLAWAPDFGRYWGNHRLSLGYDERRDESTILTYNERVYTPSLDGNGIYSVVLARVNYFDPDDNTTHNLGRRTDIGPFTVTDQATGLSTEARVGFIPQGTGDAPGSRWQIIDRDSKIFNLQSFWLDGRIVTSYGVREDRSDTVTRLPTYFPAGSLRPPYNGLAFSTLDYNGYEEPDPLDGRRSSDFRATAWSVVLHLDKRKNFSLFYNDSGNSQDPTSNRALPNSVAPSAASKSTSREYGVRMSLFDDKASLRFSRFDTTQRDNYAASFQVSGGFWYRFTRAGGAIFNNPAQAPLRIVIDNPDGTTSVETYNSVQNGGSTHALDEWLNLISSNNIITAEQKAVYERVLGINPDFFNATEKNTGVTALKDDGGAKGYEAQITLRPTRSVDLILNYSYVDLFRDDPAGDGSEWLDTFYDQLNQVPASVLDAPYDLLTPRPTRPGPNGTIPLLTPLNNAEGIALDRPAGGYTRRTVFDATFQTLRQWLDEIIQERSAGYGARKHNFNATARYSFREGRLKGLSVGAGYTYRSDAVIATLRQAINGEIVPRTLRGDSLWNSRAFFTYRCAPNLFGRKHNITLSGQIENLLQNDLERIPLRLRTTVAFDPSAGTTRILSRDRFGNLIPTNFSYKLPRAYNFTASFEF